MPNYRSPRSMLHLNHFGMGWTTNDTEQDGTAIEGIAGGFDRPATNAEGDREVCC